MQLRSCYKGQSVFDYRCMVFGEGEVVCGEFVDYGVYLDDGSFDAVRY